MHTFLTVGKAYYIGSHVVKVLKRMLPGSFVVENLLKGHHWTVTGAEFIQCDLGETDILTKFFSN